MKTRAWPRNQPAVLNAHAQSDFWASGAATRASQMTQTREMLNEMARERYSRLDSRDSACDMTTLLVGDLVAAVPGSDCSAWRSCPARL